MIPVAIFFRPICFLGYIVCGVLFFCAAKEESEDGEGTIDEEDFETEFVAEEEFD